MVNLTLQPKAKFYGRRPKNLNGLGFKSKIAFKDFARQQGIKGVNFRTLSELREALVPIIARYRDNLYQYRIRDLGTSRAGLLSHMIFDNIEGFPSPTTEQQLYDTILFYGEYIRGQNGSSWVVLRFVDEDGEQAFRSVRTNTFEQFEDDIGKTRHEEGATVAQSGSDVLWGTFVVDPTWFQMWFFMEAGAVGGGAKGAVKKVISKFYTLKNHKSSENNCLIANVRGEIKFKTRVKTIRQELNEKYKIPIGTFITLPDIPYIEDYFCCKINIMGEESLEDVIYTSEKEYKEEVNLLLFDNHYSVIKKVKKVHIKKEEKKQNKPKELYLYFDFETIFDRSSNNYLKPYSVAWFVHDPAEKFEYNKKKHFKDSYFETERPVQKLLDFILTQRPAGTVFKLIGFNNSRFDNFFLANCAYRDNCLGQNLMFVNNSILLMTIKGNRTFDLCRFLATSLDTACDDFNVYPKKMKGFSHKVVQDVFDKGGKAGLDTWLLENHKLIEEYNKLDVLSLCDLTMKCEYAVEKLTGQKITDFLTIGQMGYEHQKKCQKKEGIFTPSPLTFDDDKFIRSALTAGRTQCYYKLVSKIGAFRMIDVKSLYPFVMMNREFPVGEYEETGKEVKGKLGIYNCYIIHQNLKWENKRAINKYFKKSPEFKTKYAPIVYPLRSDKADVALDWTHRGEMDCVLTSVDIKCIRDYGGKVKVGSGIYWEQSSKDLFTQYLKPFMDEKNKQDKLKKQEKELIKKKFNNCISDIKKQEKYLNKCVKDGVLEERYNNALRELTKLFSNALSGKVIQKNYEDVFKDIRSTKDLLEFFKKVKPDSIRMYSSAGAISYFEGKLKEAKIYKPKSAKPSYLGVFIYAHARDYMYRTILGKYATIYQDTDSALLELDEFNRFIADDKERKESIYETGKYGCLEEEVGEATKIITINPKCYCVINRVNKKNSKMKFKGIRKGSMETDQFGNEYLKGDVWMKYEDFKEEYKIEPEQMGESEIEELRFKIKNLALSEEMFDVLYNKEPICIFQSQLTKLKGFDVLTGKNKNQKNKSITNAELNIMNEHPIVKEDSPIFQIKQRFIIKTIGRKKDENKKV